MNNVVAFRLRKFRVLFNMPDNKVIRVCKSESDNVSINIDGNSGFAIVEATTKQSAETKLLTILPDSKIIQTLFLQEST